MESKPHHHPATGHPALTGVLLGIAGYLGSIAIISAVAGVLGLLLETVPAWLPVLIISPLVMEAVRLACLQALIDLTGERLRPAAGLAVFACGWIVVDIGWALVSIVRGTVDGAVAAAFMVQSVQPLALHLLSACVAFWLTVRGKLPPIMVLLAMIVCHVAMAGLSLIRPLLVEPVIYPDQLLSAVYLLAAALLVWRASFLQAVTRRT